MPYSLGVMVIGPPNGGKGTMVERISLATGVVRVVVSDLVRAKKQTDPKFAARAKEIMDRGDLLGDDEINPLVKEAIEGVPWLTDAFLDGACRTPGQFIYTRDQLLIHKMLPLVFILKLSRKSANERRLTRIQEFLDRGEEPRPDDLDEEVFNGRLDTYESQYLLVRPEIDRLHPSFVFEIDAEVGPDEVFRAAMMHYSYYRPSTSSNLEVVEK